MIIDKKISQSVTLLSSQDPDLKIFDIIMETKYGTTYNSYLVDGGEEVALIDSAKEEYFDEYLKKLKKITSLKKIKYIIVNHTEPDHSGEIGKLIDKIPNVVIVGTPSAIGFLKDITNRSFEYIEVKEDFKLKVGDKELEFIIAPNLHWPDSMFTYLKSEEIMFTCDVFGAHYCSDFTFVDEIKEKKDEYIDAKKYYYDCIFSPFKKYVLNGMDYLKNKKIKIISPSHGPLIRENINKTIKEYEKWSKIEKIEENKVIIVYTSAYGYTQRLAQEIAKGIKTQKIQVELLDLVITPTNVAIDKIKTSSAFLVGSPTLNGDTLPQIWNVLLGLSSLDMKDRLAGAFGVFGWSGEAVRNIESRLSQLRCEVYRPGLRIKFNPETEIKLEKARNFGIAFGKKLKAQNNHSEEWAKVKTGLWKCLICGELFEGEYPPQECNVCRADSSQFIEVNKNESSFKSNKRENIVIVGSGISAISAIESIRERNKVSKITLFSQEEELPYYRILLSKKLCTKDKCEFKNLKWFKDNNVTLNLGKTVEKIEPETNNIIVDNKKINYSKLLIATGASANKIPIHGDLTNGIFSLRNKKDFESINQFSKRKTVQNIIIQGGGILGIEVAAAFKKDGKNVTIIEFANRLLPRQLDEEASLLFKEHLEKQGIKIICGQTIEEIFSKGDKNKVIESLKLAHDNKKIKCDMLIQNTGIKVNLKTVKNTGISFNKGIIVNQTMNTNYNNIYAAGDVAEYNSQIGGLWSIALEQGYIAGAQIVGDEQVKYIQKPLNTSFNDLGIQIFSIGDIGSVQEKTDYQILELKDPKQENYRKFFFLDNEFVGGILIGDCSKSIQLRKAVDKKSSMQHFLDMHFLD